MARGWAGVRISNDRGEAVVVARSGERDSDAAQALVAPEGWHRYEAAVARFTEQFRCFREPIERQIARAHDPVQRVIRLQKEVERRFNRTGPPVHLKG